MTSRIQGQLCWLHKPVWLSGIQSHSNLMFRGLESYEGGWLSSTARQRASLPAVSVGGEFTALPACLSKPLHFLFFSFQAIFFPSLPLLQAAFYVSTPSSRYKGTNHLLKLLIIKTEFYYKHRNSSTNLTFPHWALVESRLGALWHGTKASRGDKTKHKYSDVIQTFHVKTYSKYRGAMFIISAPPSSWQCKRTHLFHLTAHGQLWEILPILLLCVGSGLLLCNAQWSWGVGMWRKLGYELMLIGAERPGVNPSI